MKNKLLFLNIFILFITINAYAQFFNNGADIKVCKNAQVYIKGNVLNDTGYFNNDGLIVMMDDFINHSIFVSGQNSYVKLEGDTQEVGGTKTIPFWNLFIAGTYHKFFTGSTEINDSLYFVMNKILLYDSNIVLNQGGHPYNASGSKHIVTSGNGHLVKKVLPPGTNYLLPVSDTLTSYKPITINYTGVIDTFFVRVRPGIHPTTGGDSATVYSTYYIREENPTGTTAAISLGWNGQDEQPHFNSAYAMMWQYMQNQWLPLSGLPGAINNMPGTSWRYGVSGLHDFDHTTGIFIIRSMPVPIIVKKPEPAIVCEDTKAEFSIYAVSMDSVIFYQWQINCGSGWQNIVDDHIYTGSNSTDFTINQTNINLNGCYVRCYVANNAGFVYSDSLLITVFPKPIADFYAIETQIDIQTYADFFDMSTNAVAWEWDFGDQQSSFLQNPSHLYGLEGFFTVILTVTSPDGCIDSIVKVDYIDVIGPDIFVPSLFTPNGDGINDVLFVRGQQLTEFEFAIFNQLGYMVFYTDNQDYGWTGSNGGIDQPQGNYAWVVKGVSRKDGLIQKQGVVTLVR